MDNQSSEVLDIEPPLAAELADAPGPGRRSRVSRDFWPGLGLCAAVGLAVLALGSVVPSLSPMLVAILAGIVLRNVVPIHAALEPGIALAAKRVLRWGVVLLGLQVSIPTIIGLGPGVLVIVTCAVAITFCSTLAMGRLLRMDRDMYTLIAAGFSICGAAAVAGMQGTIRASEE